MEYDFTDMQTGESVEAGTYPLVELVREHRRRWVLRTGAGAVVLRRMPLRMQRLVEAARRARGPRVRALLDELNALRPFMEGLKEDEIDQETRDRAMDLAHQLMLQDLAPLAVIEAPELTCTEDYDDLLRMLTPEERITLQEAVTEMARVRPPEEVDATALDVAERLGVQVVPEDMIDAMTVSQAEYWVARINEERRALRRMQEARR